MLLDNWVGLSWDGTTNVGNDGVGIWANIEAGSVDVAKYVMACAGEPIEYQPGYINYNIASNNDVGMIVDGFWLYLLGLCLPSPTASTCLTCDGADQIFMRPPARVRPSSSSLPSHTSASDLLR